MRYALRRLSEIVYLPVFHFTRHLAVSVRASHKYFPCLHMYDHGTAISANMQVYVLFVYSISLTRLIALSKYASMTTKSLIKSFSTPREAFTACYASLLQKKVVGQSTLQTRFAPFMVAVPRLLESSAVRLKNLEQESLI